MYSSLPSGLSFRSWTLIASWNLIPLRAKISSSSLSWIRGSTSSRKALTSTPEGYTSANLAGSWRHRKVSHSRGLGPAARWGGVPKVAPKPSPYMVLCAVWLEALVFQKVAPEPPPWPVGVLVVAPMGWCSKSWGGVPKSCPRIPTLSKLTHMIISCRDLRLVALVFQKVVPEPPPWPVGVLVVTPIGWCSESCGGVPKSCPRIPTLYTTFLG